MSAREYAIKRLREFGNTGLRVVDEETVLDAIIGAIKEECCKESGTPVSMGVLWGLAEDNIKRSQLIQGYTAEQWQEIIAGGYLCEFGVGGETGKTHLGTLKERRETGNFVAEKDSYWANCRPAQIKGVMRPIFVEPVDITDSKNLFVFFDSAGNALHDGMAVWTYCLNPENRSRVAKYIEP